MLFTIKAPGANDAAQVAVLDLTTGQRTILIRGGSQAEYFDLSTRSEPGGYLVYALAGTLRAVRFDPETRTVVSDPVPVVEQVFDARGQRGGGVQRLAAGRAGVCRAAVRPRGPRGRWCG